MPYARSCDCPRPRVFEHSETCQRCGHEAQPDVSASTMRIAIAIAEVLKGLRPIGDDKYRGGSRAPLVADVARRPE